MRARQYVEATFDGPCPDESALQDLPGVERVSREGDRMLLYTQHPGRTAVALAGLADREGLEVRALSTRKPSLEDVFLFLTNKGGEEAAP